MSQPAQPAVSTSTQAPLPGRPRSRPPRRLKRWLIALGILALLGLIAGELVARFALRLGDPPLYVADPQVEYLMVPSSTYHRFYATSTYNRWSMRATPELEKTKADPNELRILVMGDSIVNGGPQTDDAELVTSLLTRRLPGRTRRPTLVANISAGSWGPANLLGYSKKFGFFAADYIVLVLNHEDATDVPTFKPLRSEHPTRKPILALEEVIFRYIPAWLGRFRTPAAATELPPERQLELEDQALGSLRQLVAAGRASGAQVIAVLHASREEAESGRPKPGALHIRQVLTELGVPVADSTEAFRTATIQGHRVYRDDLHPMPQGQTVLANVIYDALDRILPR
jgi:hypothetical protein